MALHSGQAEEREGDYFGPPVNRVARILSAGHGGQILVSSEVAEAVRQHLGERGAFVPMGQFLLKGLSGSQGLVQALPTALATRTFNPIRADRSSAAE